MCFHLHPEILMIIPTQHNFSVQSMWGFGCVFLEGKRGRVSVFGFHSSLSSWENSFMSSNPINYKLSPVQIFFSNFLMPRIIINILGCYKGREINLKTIYVFKF